MISSLYEIHLKKDFPNLWKESDEVKLNLLLDYINGRKDIKNSKPLKHSQTFT